MVENKEYISVMKAYKLLCVTGFGVMVVSSVISGVRSQAG